MINSDTTTDSDEGKPPATEPAVEEINADLKPVDQSRSPVNEPGQGSEANEPNRESSFTRRALLLKAGAGCPGNSRCRAAFNGVSRYDVPVASP